jgi:hypothetical protein
MTEKYPEHVLHVAHLIQRLGDLLPWAQLEPVLRGASKRANYSRLNADDFSERELRYAVSIADADPDDALVLIQRQTDAKFAKAAEKALYARSIHARTVAQWESVCDLSRAVEHLQKAGEIVADLEKELAAEGVEIKESTE